MERQCGLVMTGVGMNVRGYPGVLMYATFNAASLSALCVSASHLKEDLDLR